MSTTVPKVNKRTSSYYLSIVNVEDLWFDSEVQSLQLYGVTETYIKMFSVIGAGDQL